MDRRDAQRALILIGTIGIARERERLVVDRRERENSMAGEIREKMAQLRAARAKMVAGLAAEIDAVTEEVHGVHADGLDALKLPRAEIAAHRQEIREIRDEFATLTNGGPAGPLAGDAPTSPAPSVNSGSQGGEPEKPQPQKSWDGQK